MKDQSSKRPLPAATHQEKVRSFRESLIGNSSVSLAMASGHLADCPWRIENDGLLVIGDGQNHHLHLELEKASDLLVWPWLDYGLDIQAIKTEGRIQVTGPLDGAFAGLVKVKTIDLSGFDVSEVNSLCETFTNCIELQKIEFADWNVQHVEHMGRMLKGCINLTEIDLSRWNTSSLQTMPELFRRCARLVNLDLSGWDTSHVTNMSSLFMGCLLLKDPHIGNWDVSHVQDLSFLFHKCFKLQPSGLENWNPCRVENMANLFYDCTSITHLDLSGWHTDHLKFLWSAFDGCSNLKWLNLAHWNVSQVEFTDMTALFRCCFGLQSLDLANWNPPKLTPASQDASQLWTEVSLRPFIHCDALQNIICSRALLPLLETLPDQNSWQIDGRSYPKPALLAYVNAHKGEVTIGNAAQFEPANSKKAS